MRHNGAICIGYLRDKKKCLSCNVECDIKPEYCRNCIIKNCEHLKRSNSGFCFECPKFLCRRLKQLDKRYSTKYHMSMIDNSTMIKETGIELFLINEKEKWTCPDCHARLSAHRDYCRECGLKIFL